jgi:FkbH-like protein
MSILEQRSPQQHLRAVWRSYLRSATPETIPDMRIGLSGSFTLDPMLPYLGGLLTEMGYGPRLVNADYNQCLRACVEPASVFGDEPQDVIVIIWRLEDIADPSSPEAVQQACEMLLEALLSLSQRMAGQIIVSLPPRPRSAVSGLVEFARADPLVEVWFYALAQVANLARSTTNIYLVDFEEIIGVYGEGAMIDHRKELLYRQPYTELLHFSLARSLARVLSARRSVKKKCLVLDCDNTLWGGIVGEDGVGSIQLSDDFPGLAFRRFQMQIAALRQSGVFIALNSKNNPDEVWKVFDDHTAMKLRRTDISAYEINWRPKSENLRDIAAALNIGLDALVFVDDNPFEIEEVRSHAPEVASFQVPSDIADLPILMREIAQQFERLDITNDDKSRVDMMHVESERRDLKQKMTEEDFLASLSLEVFIYRPTPADLGRVTQLINKTNQFNVTTRRYEPGEVARMIDAPDIDFFCVSVRDKFGEYGLVGVAIIKHGSGGSEFDSLLMSCRVLGRGIETAMMAHAVDLALKRGISKLEGLYIPTNKNQMVEDVFARHGFVPVFASPVESRWCYAQGPLATPSFLKTRIRHPTAMSEERPDVEQF